MPDRIVAIVQARLGSTRYPNKILQQVAGQPLLHTLIRRIQQATLLDHIILAIPNLPTDDPLEQHARQLDVDCYRGHPTDLLDRYYQASQTIPATDHIVRITSDCPLIDPTTIDQTITIHQTGNHTWTAPGPTFPDGVGLQICQTDLLHEAWHTTTDPYDREHVFPYILRKDGGNSYPHTSDLTTMRVTIDYPEDLTVLHAIATQTDFTTCTLADLEHLWNTQPHLFDANRHCRQEDAPDTFQTQQPVP
jgi:glutamate-1-semialdehyde 2,1-aminomutase